MASTYQPFGQSTNSDYGKPRGAGKTHWGQDFTADSGTQIPSATAGTVIFSGYNPSGGLGWCVVVKDANGVGHVYAHMGEALKNNAKTPPEGMPSVGESIGVGDSLGPVGNTGHVIPAPTDEKPYLGTHLHIATVDADASSAIEAQGKAIGTGGSGSLGVRLDGSTTLNPDAYIQDNPELFNPAPVTVPNTPDTTSSSSDSENTNQTDPMGSDDGKSIMDAASGGATTRPDDNYSHEGRNNPTPSTPTPKPPPDPAGDTVDAELPDGTRVVSTSTTVNGQTTVTAELRDTDGHVLLSAGAGQTMERDPDTGIVRVRTEGSEQVQQYDPATGEVGSGVLSGGDAAAAYDAVLDAFGNPNLPTFGPGTDYADAGGAGDVVSDAGGGVTPVTPVAPTPATPAEPTNLNTLNNYLGSQGDSLTAAQQSALTAQVNGLGLGGEGDLSFYSLPGGGALIANADGDIVGEIVHSNSGSLNLKANGIDAQGNPVEVNNHISEQGQVVSDNALVQQQAANMFNSLMAVNNWDHLTDVGKLSALVNLYNATDKLGEAFGATGDNLPGDLGAAAGYLQLAQGLQSGDNLIIANGLNTVSGGAVDQAIGSMVGQELPYVSTLLELRNFADNPEQAALTMAGTYVGEAFGAAIGAAIGGAIGGMIGGMVGSALGDDPPAPEGAAHFSWDANGHIQHTVDFSVSGGGEVANSVAASVQNMLQSLVDAHNAQNASTADDIALNPYCLPTIHFKADWGGATVEIPTADGHVATHNLNSADFGQWLVQTIQDTGGLAPAWQVQTIQAHVQQQRAAGVDEVEIAREAGITATVGAHAGDAAYSVQGNAAESTDFKSQSFGALVVHLNDNPDVQAAQTQLSEVLRDVEGDGYLEKAQSVAARDDAGNLQAVLTLDFNGDGVIQTRDILNLGGNAAENLSVGGQQANANADLQRNNVQWLDSNGDGVLDKTDPAFSAIRLWVDVNQDYVQQGNEASSLQSMHISSINFGTGEVTYEDGHTDALTAQTLKADTEGVKFSATDAGAFLEHEGYQGEQLVTDITGTYWRQVRDQTYEQQATRTGDWEGTAEQDEHRHGGGNVADAPTETSATGATDFGPVRTFTTTMQSTVTEGSARVVSDVPTETPQAQTNTQTTVTAGDNRIKSNTATTNGAASSTASTTNTTNTTSTRIVFVPTGATSIQNETQAVTDSMIESAQGSLFGMGVNTGISVLTAVGLGAVQNVQAAEQRPALVSDVLTPSITTTPNTVSSSNMFSSTSSGSSTDANTASVTFRQVDLGVFNVQQVVQTPTPATASQNTVASSTVSTPTEPPSTTFVYATVITSANANGASSSTGANTGNATSSNTSTVSAPPTPTASPLSLGYPVVQAETLPGTEDVVLHLTQSVLLANDSTPNASADPTQPALTITAVSAPLHGQVSLVDGEVLFAPDTNFHGTASFTYTVTDQYGLSTNGTATLQITAVNDAPVTQGELVASDEDIGLIFTQAQLLANDTDVDVVTDGQVLSISRVGDAQHGTVSLDAQGQVRFAPDLNYHGPAQFTYWVSDGLAANGAGAEVPATVRLTILAVNDLPVVTGETLNNRQEDVSLLFNPATLLANDTDVDTATDGQVLTITNISNAQHGTVAWATQPDGSQYIAFTPEANYFGVASYQYTVSDGNGGTATTTVVVNLTEVNDTPVAADDSLSSTAEDTALHISFASLLGNDTDADSHNAQWGGVDDVLTVTVVGNAVHGTVALVNGEVVFTPEANYHGPASFAYQVSDSSGAVSQALATFSVTAVNDVPVAAGETISENEDTPLLISQAALLQNDSDVDVTTDGQVLTITAVSNAQHGTVTLNANGTISFEPVTNFYGNASFDYIVSDGNGGTTTTTATIALANVNDAPVATGETINSNEDEVLTIIASTLLQNDSDIDNARADLTISRVQSGAGGTVSLNASGNVVFTPTANYNGNATFTYWVKDPGGLESNAVITSVVLAAVNDAPTVQGEIVTGASEDAVFNISSSTLLANDHDVDDPDSALSLSWVGNATGGTVSLNASGNVVFTPTLNFNGNATFQYKVQDAAGLESAVVQALIPVAAVNDTPVAVDDQFTTYINSTMTIAFNELTGNDIDVDRDALTVSAVRDYANGHASIVNGQVQFVADTDFKGQASFDYLTDDGHGEQIWATAFIDVKERPNQYPTLNVTGVNFFGTGGPGIDVAYASWSAVDDGNARLVTFQLQQVLVSGGYYGDSWSTVQAATQYQFDATHMYVDVRRWSGFTKLQCTALLTDDRGLQNIWYFDYDMATGYTSYADHSGYYYPPIVIDLNGDGTHYTSLVDSKVAFDVNFDGLVDRMAWAGNDDGVLVWDKDQNHQITDASEFGFQTLKADAQTDLEGLQALDTNDNGLLDAGDAKFAEFAVWQDANGNGVTDAGEFKTLTDLGIASINLHSDGQMRDAGTLLANSGSGETDVTVMGNAAFTRTDGSTGVVADTMLAYEAGHAGPKVVDSLTSTSAADAQTAEIIRQALLFNQVCNTAVAVDSAPLGFVPIQPDVQLHDMLVAPQDGSHQLMQSA